MLIIAKHYLSYPFIVFIYDGQIDKVNVDGWINFYGSVILYYVWLKIKDIFTHNFVMKCKSSVDFINASSWKTVVWLWAF